MSRSGADLALLLLGGFRALVDAASVELADRGYEDVRPVHDFAMRAIAAGADSASELGRRLSITKQSAAKTIAVLQERGYVTRDTDPRDARRKRLQVTELGFDVLRQGEGTPPPPPRPGGPPPQAPSGDRARLRRDAPGRGDLRRAPRSMGAADRRRRAGEHRGSPHCAGGRAPRAFGPPGWDSPRRRRAGLS